MKKIISMMLLDFLLFFLSLISQGLQISAIIGARFEALFFIVLESAIFVIKGSMLEINSRYLARIYLVT